MDYFYSEYMYDHNIYGKCDNNKKIKIENTAHVNYTKHIK